jgi:hypothetical protein
MIHVLNPYQLSTSMFRLAAFTFEAQLHFVRAFTHLSTHANPAFVTREAIIGTAEKEEKKTSKAPIATKKSTKPASLAKAKTVRKPAVRKPAAAKSVTDAAPKSERATVEEMKSVAKTARPPQAKRKVAPKTASAAKGEAKTYRAPSTPPAMPEATASKK